MSRIPFLLIRTFNPEETTACLEDRFYRHLCKLRGLVPRSEEDDEMTSFPNPQIQGPFVVREEDRYRIRKRARRIFDARKAASGLDRLKTDDRTRLEKLHAGVQLASVPSEARIDELAASLHAEFPWLGPATESAWRSLHRSRRDGLPGVRLQPLLLDGPPGIGKSVWARHLAALLGAPATLIDATNESASFGIVGSQRGWGNSAPGRVLTDMIQHKVGNPVIVIDEIEKAGTPVSSKGRTFDLTSALLPLLEQATAKQWTCPYHELPFDMSWIGWVLTSNNARLLPEPLLSRCPPLQLRNPVTSELVGFARREGGRRHLSEPAIDALVEALQDPRWRDAPPNLRVVIRMLERAADLESRPLPH